MNLMVVVALVILTGPNGQHIEVNPHSIVSIREPRGNDHFSNDVKCLLHTSDGKFITVVETCDEVIIKLQEENEE